MFSKKSFEKMVGLVAIWNIISGLTFMPQWRSAAVRPADLHNPDTARMIVVEDSQSLSLSAIDPVELKSIDDTDDGNLTTVNTMTSRQPEDWQAWNVVPELTPNALLIYKRGLDMGNNPSAFSKIGDGEISAAWFLTDFDLGPNYYDLGVYSDLSATISYFSGSFGRQSQSARRGFNVQRVLDPSLTDQDYCLDGETPLDCEIRLHHPSFALISMGTNQVWQPEQFESGMRVIIETLINRGVVPILSTKADNLEGDNSINLITAKLAVEFDLPLWNFWRAVQSMPDHGLQDDLEHLSYYPNRFDNPDAMNFAWPMRNLSALQVLEKLMRETQP